MTDPVTRHASYDSGVLTLGDAKLPVPGYEVSTAFKAPTWSAEEKVVIESRDAPISSPVIAAVVLDARGAADPPGELMDDAEAGLYGERAPTALADGTVGESKLECRYRVKHGDIDGEGTLSASGVIIATSTSRPSVGVFIHGPDALPVQRLTVEMAGQLCPGPPAGA